MQQKTILPIREGQLPLPDSEIKREFMAVTERLIRYYLMLRQEARQPVKQEEADVSSKSSHWADACFYSQILELVEEPLISLALEAKKHNQTKAAEALSISRGTFKHKLKQYGIKKVRQLKRPYLKERESMVTSE